MYYSLGVYKVPYSTPLGVGRFIKSVGEEYKVVERERDFHECRVEIKGGKKGRGKQNHLPCNSKAVRKNIKRGKVEGNGNFGEDNQI